MISEKCDITVLGAGPGGSRLATLAAANGLEVVVLEKRERIGYPVRCAEAVGPREEIERYLSVDQSLICSPINGVKVVSPGGAVFQTQLGEVGFITDRELFDRRLAERAKREGAEIRIGHQALGLLRNNGIISGVRVRKISSGEEYRLECSVVVGADGVEALSPRWAGIAGSIKLDDIFSCAQELIETSDHTPPIIEFHLGRRFAPGGYGWIFPKEDRKANIGVGVKPLFGRQINAVEYLERFIEHTRAGAEKKRLILGGCEVSRGLTDLVTDGYMVVGEAARQNNPFSGGGIVNALEAADMAADVLIKAVRKGDTSRRALTPYSVRWRKSVGRSNRIYYYAARIFFQLGDRDMDKIIEKVACKGGIIYKGGIRPFHFIKSIILSKPSLIFKLLGSLRN
jgi:digeranylgeranylglycerophospholipid reductase